MDGDGGERSLQDVLLDRLDASDLDDEAKLLVLAAVEGDVALAQELDEAAVPPAAAGQPSAPPRQPVSAYLDAVTVRAFRGIGPQATLRLQPTNGLTLVVGRNGSGKSSFAEAVEVAFTGTSYRWQGRRTVDWRSGWRNLHCADPAYVRVDLAVDGDRGRTAVERTWPENDLDRSDAWVQRPGEKRAPLATLSWGREMETYRPFLSYSELGAMLDGGPSGVYDALAAILGLDDLTAAEKRLNDARKALDAAARELDGERKGVLVELTGSDDPRAREAEQALQAKQPDLDAVERLATSRATDAAAGCSAGCAGRAA